MNQQNIHPVKIVTDSSCLSSLTVRKIGWREGGWEEYRFKIILFFPRKGTSVLFIIVSLASRVLVCSRNSGNTCLIYLNSEFGNLDNAVLKTYCQLRKFYLHL